MRIAGMQQFRSATLTAAAMETPAPSPAEMPTPRRDIELPEPPPGDYPAQTPPEEVPPPATPQRKAAQLSSSAKPLMMVRHEDGLVSTLQRGHSANTTSLCAWPV